MSQPLYEIVRYTYPDLLYPAIVAFNKTLEEAQAHCHDPATREEGMFFDSYREQQFSRKPAVQEILLKSIKFVDALAAARQ